MINQIQESFFSKVTTGRKGNLFTPLTILTGVTIPSLLVGAYKLQNTFWMHILIGLVVFLIIASFGVYIYLLLKRPKDLKSEDYQIREKQLDLIASKGHVLQDLSVGGLNLNDSTPTSLLPPSEPLNNEE